MVGLAQSVSVTYTVVLTRESSPSPSPRSRYLPLSVVSPFFQPFQMAAIRGIFCTMSNDFALCLPILQALYSETHPGYLDVVIIW